MSNSTPAAAVARALETAAAAVAAGQPGQAERMLRRAAAAHPAELPLWDALVGLYRERGLNEPAAECLAHAARVHASQGNLDAARNLMTEACTLDPGNPRLLHDYGVACLHGGDAEAAQAAFRKVLGTHPDDDLARLNLARALERTNRLDESEALYRQVMGRRPDAPEPARELAWLLRSAGRFDAAETGFRTVLDRWPGDPDAAVGLAGLLEMRGAASEARSLLEALPEPARERPDVALTEGRLLRRAGRLEAAQARISEARTAASRDPALAPRWHFEMAATLDALGDAESAFTEAAAGNRLRATPWDRAAHRRRVDEIIRAFGAEAFAGARPVAQGGPVPVFVVGLPRSGTTLTEHLLTGFAGVVAGGERMDFLRHAASLPGYPETTKTLGTDRLAAMAADYLGDAPADTVLVDKMPVNFLHLGLIARVLPGARIIHCSRHPLDTLLSCYFQDFTAPFLGFANDLEDLAWYWQDYQRLMNHWADVLTLPVLDLPYEALVSDPQQWVHRLGRFIGRNEAPARAPEHGRFIATNSTAQVRRPISDRAVGRHRAYARELAALAGMLGVSPPG